MSAPRFRRTAGTALAALLASAPTAAPASQAEDAERVAWLRSHLVPLRTIDPADDDFADLMPLVESIGAARIVALGEATHGDASAFQAKARLVRFLHEVMGFDVLAWESPMVGCRAMDDAMRAGAPADEAARMGPFGMWSDVRETQPLFDYVRATQSTPRPMLSAGFDARLWGTGSKTALPEYLFEVFDRIAPGFLSERDRTELLEMVDGLDYTAYYQNPGPRGFRMELPKRMRALLADAPPRVRARLSPRESAFALRQLDNLLGLEAWLATVGADPPAPKPNRDVLMAENLLWLARVFYPDRKIIAWGHNYHVMASLYTLSDLEAMERVEREGLNGGPMGMHVRRAIGADYYAIGFAGYAGRTADLAHPSEALPVPPPEPGTLDALLHETGQANLFLDLRGLPADHWLRRPTVGRFYFWRPAETIWSRVFDGIVYTDALIPTTRIGALGSGDP